MKTALVTGAAGFIGSHLVDRLLADGWNVTGIDNFDAFYARSIKEANLQSALDSARFRLIEGDICDVGLLTREVKGPFDVIVHLAAKAGVRPSIDDPVGYNRVNVMGTLNLLEMVRRLGVRQFVFASSSSVYGVNPRVPWRETDAVLLPISPYASTKVSGELLGHVYAHLYGIRFVALRFFTAYGPRQRPDLAIHRFARLMLEGRPIPVFGNGETRRDYTYVDDVVSGVCASMTYEASPYEVINLGNNRTVTLNEMIAGLESALGVRAIVDRQSEQPGDVPQTWASIDKARALLGYDAKTPFAEGSARFVKWLRSSSPLA